MSINEEAYPGSKSKLQIVGAERVVFNGCIDHFVKKRRFAEEILGHS